MVEAIDEAVDDEAYHEQHLSRTHQASAGLRSCPKKGGGQEQQQEGNGRKEGGM